MSISFQDKVKSKVFWPCYVDAMTNLAISLLSVIAVMSLVLVFATLEIKDLSKLRKNLGPSPRETTTLNAAEFTLAELQDDLKTAQANLKATQARLVESQRKIQQNAAVQSPVIPLSTNLRTEIVADGALKKKAILQDESNGLAVNFAKDTITLSSTERSELVTKLTTYGNLKNNRWLITVISPKGFSETLRVSYYRANSIRNVLIENGVVGGAIDLKIQESTQAESDKSTVWVKLQR